ncbi:MAG: hypothetical protein WCS70_06670 [Verrucomicrobiota bacterium]
MNYPLAEIFQRAFKEFQQLNIEVTSLEHEYVRNKNWRIAERIFQIVPKRTEAGVVTLFSAMAWLEKTLHDYAICYLDPDSYDEHFGNARALTRWLLVPRICQNKIIEEDNSAINDLRELIHARNSVVHPKRQIMNDTSGAHQRVDKEAKRFLSACRKAGPTVSNLRQLLLTAADKK